VILFEFMEKLYSSWN